MSRGPGWIEREIRYLLESEPEEPRSVYYLAFMCHMKKEKRWKDKNLYKSVCRTVRRLEDEGYLASRNFSIKDLDKDIYRYSDLGHYPTYVKLVWIKVKWLL